MALDPKIGLERKFKFVDPSTGARICASEYVVQLASHMGYPFFTCPEMPWKYRGTGLSGQYRKLLPWPAMDLAGDPRSPRGPTSGVPDAGYRECWGRLRARTDPPTILTWQADPISGLPDYTVCRNTPANGVGADCFGTLDFGVGGGVGYPSTVYYVPTEPTPESKREPICGLVCACCPCASFCIDLPSFSASLYIGGFLEGTLNFPGTGGPICIENSDPEWVPGGGWGWVRAFGDNCSSPYQTSGTVGSETYRLALSSMIVYSPPVGTDDCYITVRFTFDGMYTTAGGVCEVCDCSGPGGTLNPLCTNPNCPFSITADLSFSINDCPRPADPAPKIAPIEDMILAHNRQPTYVVAFPTGGDVELTCPDG